MSPAALRRVQTHGELAGAGDFALWPDGSMTVRCPWCSGETWLKPAPVMLAEPVTLNGVQTLACGRRLWILAGKAETSC